MHLPRQCRPLCALLAMVLALLLMPRSGTAAETEPAFVRARHLSVALLPSHPSIQPGGTADLGLYFSLEKGWHVYWVNAGDSGDPPSIQWTLPSGITAGPMQFPAPRRLPLGPLMDFGYENEVLFPMTLHASPALKEPSTVPLSARVDWLVCREVCIPGKTVLTLPLQIAAQAQPPDAATQALFDRFRARLPRPLPSSAQAVFAPASTGFTLAITGQPISSAGFFPLGQVQIANSAPQPVKEVQGGIEISLTKDENFRGPLTQLNGVLVEDDGTAYLIHAHPGPLPAVTSRRSADPILRFSALAFLGGVLLNLMPCVFPVLFLKGLSLVHSSREEYSRIRLHGLAYASGILVSFWAVVAVLLALRAGGHHLGWGFQFQSPSFLAVMVLLLFFLGLSLAGMFDIGLTITGVGSGLAARGGYTGSFFTGVLAMVVATPCTAPFMGAAVGFALAQRALIAFSVFTALALGLAAPYLLLTWRPAWTRLLPRPGAWMEVLKQATAVPIFLFVVWLLWVFAATAGVNAQLGLMAALVLLAIAGWILGRWPARRLPFAWALLIIALAVAVPLFALRKFSLPENKTAAASTSRDSWQPFSQASVDAYRAQGRPVFVDFTARWCLSCQVNERVVLDRADVQRRLRDSGIALVRADWTLHDPEIAAALNRLGRSGVPTYVLYSSSGPARILPEVLTPGIIFQALDGLATSVQQQGGRSTPVSGKP